MITRVPGIRVGHWTDPVGLTGCTVILCPSGTLGSGQVRGGAPGTRETDLLRPGTLVQEVHAVLLAGGSAFGLAAADGVMRFLEERSIGFDTRVAKVPIVPAAVLFDLGVGDPNARPGPEQGYAACLAIREEVPEGSVGAGTGATVAKLHGVDRGVKGGLATAAAEDGDLIVGALAAVNAYGEVIAEDGSVLATAAEGLGAEEGSPSDEPGTRRWTEGPGDQGAGEQPGLPGVNTTLVVVATNAKLNKERAHLLAIASHEGIDAAVRPAHTVWDGDAVFTLATGAIEADQRTLETLAVGAVSEAIRRAVPRRHQYSGLPHGEGG